MRIKGFTISYHNSVVEIVKGDVPFESFDEELSEAHSILRVFRQTKPGTTWGCDGIGYNIQRQAGIVRVCKSGVGLRAFCKGLAELGIKRPQ